jgi:hypothetical protein
MKNRGQGGTPERRSLVAGVKPAVVIDRKAEEQFVFASKAKTDQPALPPMAPSPSTEPRDAKQQGSVTRAPFTTRLRADFAEALKRASLERQLNKQFPNTLQDILEEALEPWLRTNGYLK